MCKKSAEIIFKEVPSLSSADIQTRLNEIIAECGYDGITVIGFRVNEEEIKYDMTEINPKDNKGARILYFFLLPVLKFFQEFLKDVRYKGN